MIKPQKDFVKNKHPHLMIPMKELGYPDGQKQKYKPFIEWVMELNDEIRLLYYKITLHLLRHTVYSNKSQDLPRPRIIVDGKILKELRMYKPKLPIIISEEPIFQRV